MLSTQKSLENWKDSSRVECGHCSRQIVWYWFADNDNSLIQSHIYNSIFWKPFTASQISKSSAFRRCAMMCLGRSSASATGSCSCITEWCVISARRVVNSFLHPYNSNDKDASCMNARNIKWEVTILHAKTYAASSVRTNKTQMDGAKKLNGSERVRKKKNV